MRNQGGPAGDLGRGGKSARQPLAAQLSAWAHRHGLDIDPAIALRGVLIWSRLHGFVSLEIAGSLVTGYALDRGEL